MTNPVLTDLVNWLRCEAADWDDVLPDEESQFQTWADAIEAMLSAAPTPPQWQPDEGVVERVRSELIRLAAKCHGDKWEFGDPEDMRKSSLIGMCRSAFDRLHKLGDELKHLADIELRAVLATIPEREREREEMTVSCQSRCLHCDGHVPLERLSGGVHKGEYAHPIYSQYGEPVKGNYIRCRNWDAELRSISEPLGFYQFAWLPRQCRNGKRRWLKWVERHDDGTFTLGNRAF